MRVQLGDVAGLAYRHHGLIAKPARARRDFNLVEAARDLIARRFKENVSLADLAGDVGCSVFHLARVFKSRTGFSLHAYRNQLRLRAALEGLGEGEVDLIDIALDLGFSSHSHFTEAFRRNFGKPPSVVRARL